MSTVPEPKRGRNLAVRSARSRSQTKSKLAFAQFGRYCGGEAGFAERWPVPVCAAGSSVLRAVGRSCDGIGSVLAPVAVLAVAVTRRLGRAWENASAQCQRYVCSVHPGFQRRRRRGIRADYCADYDCDGGRHHRLWWRHGESVCELYPLGARSLNRCVCFTTQKKACISEIRTILRHPDL